MVMFTTNIINISKESQIRFFTEYPEWIDYYKSFEKFLRDIFEG